MNGLDISNKNNSNNNNGNLIRNGECARKHACKLFVTYGERTLFEL